MRTFLLALALAAAGCHHDPQPAQPKPGDLPPLPPSSGTAIGYLIDSASRLKLTDDQIGKLQQLDRSLAAQNDEIDTQLRQIERPEEDEQPEKGAPPPRHNNAPGAQVKTNKDATRLHQAHAMNDKDALGRAFKLLDASQQAEAKKILEDRGISAPGEKDKAPPDHSAAGAPLEP
jgi:hypothetical protein